jgi:DNA-binding transcriptional MerR regulator
MRLAELSAATGVSPASIKFYLRAGLLPPGERINPTRAEYGSAHAERLRLIQGLRSQVGLGLDAIRRILDAAEGADRPGPRRLALLGTVQAVVLGLDGDRPHHAPAVDALIADMGWPDAESDARAAVDAQIKAMAGAGLAVDPGVLAAYGRAADSIADFQLTATESRGSLDETILTAALGMHLHNRLVLKIIALAQASQSIRRYAAGGPGAGPPATGRSR